MLHQKHNSYEYVLQLKTGVDWISIREEKYVTNSKMYILRRNAHKIKKHIFPLMAAFSNFTLKIETSAAKKAVKSILETWNVSVIVCVWFISR